MSTAPATPHDDRGPAADEKLDKRIMNIAWVVVLGSIMAILDMTVVNVAINKLSSDFESPLSTIQWIVTGYMLALATVIPLTGWASHRFGTKRLYIGSIVLFVAGSALAGAAWSAESLIFFRVLQGIGGGMIMPAGMTILTQAAGPRRVGRVMGIISVPMLIGPICGPILGGWLVDDISWRWIFFINVPIGAVAIPLAIKILERDEPQPGHPLDWKGLAMLSPGLAAFVYGLAEMASQGGFNSAKSIVPSVVGGLLILGFVLHARRDRDSLLDVHLFRERAVGAAAATMSLFSLAFFGAMLLLPLYFQLVRGESALDSGLLLAPQGLGAMLMMPVAGILTDKLGPGRIVLVGLVILLASFVPFTQLSGDTSYWYIGTALFFMGIGMGLTMMPTMTAALQRLTNEAVPRASTALNIIQQVAGALGTAILSVLLANELIARLPKAPAGGEGATGGLGAAQGMTDEVRAQLGDTMAGAFGYTFWWALGLLALAVVPALLLPRRPVEVDDHLVDEHGNDSGETVAPPVIMH